MSDTSRTDTQYKQWETLEEARDFALQLERENNELRASNDRMFKINEGLLAENAKMSEALRKIRDDGMDAAQCMATAKSALASYAAQSK